MDTMGLSRTTAIALCVTALLVGAAALTAQQNRSSNGSPTDRNAMDAAIANWTPGPKLAAQEMAAKYGQPQEVTATRVVWRDAGPYKRIMLTKEELPHNFPITHMDYLEHTISYKVPADKSDEVHAFDASITIHPGSGELSARCDLESNNVLTFNLANDIVKNGKTVEAARKEFGQAVTDRTMGNPPPSTKALQFQPMTPQQAAEVEKATVPGTSQRAADHGGKAAPDAEVMALLIALDENEVHAGMAAQEKKVSAPVMAYAQKMHREHGKDIDEVQKLGLKLNVTPLETAAVDALHNKGAAELAKVMPLTGQEFERGFIAMMVAGHTDALKNIDEWQKKAQNDALKQHLTMVRQHVATHLKEAEGLRR